MLARIWSNIESDMLAGGSTTWCNHLTKRWLYRLMFVMLIFQTQQHSKNWTGRTASQRGEALSTESALFNNKCPSTFKRLKNMLTIQYISPASLENMISPCML